jgi:hypothetical protein
MKPIKRKNVRMKNLIGIIEEPTYNDLLFEIADFLDKLGRFDGEIKVREVSFHTRVRIGKEVVDDLDELVKLGYMEKLKYTSYKLVKHLWE